MKKVLVATEKPFASEAVEGIREVIENAGYQFMLLEKYATKADLLDAVEQADALIVRSDKIDGEVIASAQNLKLIVRAGAGYDNIDTEMAKAHGIIVENTPGQNSNAVAELVFGMGIMAARNMYAGTSGFELKDKKLGLQAFGQVGRNVARIAKGFGMTVNAFDPFCSDDVMLEAGVNPVHTVESLYSHNQFVSIHIPATPQTIHSIGYDLISLMPKGGILINTARKEVIDEDGLVKALEERTDLKYVTDVKPDNADLLTEKFSGRVFFTPKKMGAQTAEANINAGIAAANQVVAYFKDGIDRFRVN